MTKICFLPGAGGSGSFWRPVADRLDPNRDKRFFSWPGLGNEPHDPRVCGLDDLVSMVLSDLSEPADLIAQSMGGLIAARVALAAPGKIRRLVLTATSAGVPVHAYGATDWRSDYQREFPTAANWITEVNEDLSPTLPLIAAPCLLIWGDADAISPPAVGRRLCELLPDARLHIVRGGDHNLAQTHSDQIAPLITEHLQ